MHTWGTIEARFQTPLSGGPKGTSQGCAPPPCTIWTPSKIPLFDWRSMGGPHSEKKCLLPGSGPTWSGWVLRGLNTFSPTLSLKMRCPGVVIRSLEPRRRHAGAAGIKGGRQSPAPAHISPAQASPEREGLWTRTGCGIQQNSDCISDYII